MFRLDTAQLEALLFQEPRREFCLQNSVSFATLTRLEPENAPVSKPFYSDLSLFYFYATAPKGAALKKNNLLHRLYGPL